MTGRPVLRTHKEKRLWKSLHGDRLSRRSSGADVHAVLEYIASHEGTLSAGLLVEAMDVLDSQGAADAESLRMVVSKSRPMDCTPSVRASEILLSRGETAAASEILSFSDRSQEVLHRSASEAKIRMSLGDRRGAMEAALRARGSDPSYPEPYGILAETDPEGGWLQMLNIQQVYDGEQPSNPSGDGRVQELFGIYRDWFFGRREAASEALARSRYYSEGDREFILASARMSVDEGDWHSAKMMYSRLLDDAPPFLVREVAEACMDAGRPARALELLSTCDPTSPKTMLDIIRARHMTGDTAGTMVAVRAYLDSEWAGSDEYLDIVRMLIGYGMFQEATAVLSVYTDSIGRDAESLILMSVISERSGDLASSLILVSEAVLRDKGSVAAKVRRAQVRLSMGKVTAAEKECAGILAADPECLEALRLSGRIQASKGDWSAAVTTYSRILERDPGDTETMLAMSKALAMTGDAPGAADLAMRAVRADGSRDTYVAALSALMSAGSGNDALYLCREAEARFPKDQVFKRIRGNMEFARGDHLRASAAFASAASEAPDEPVLWYSKGMADEARGDMESAGDAYGRALGLDPDTCRYWVAKATVLERRGDDRGAMRALRHASLLDRGDVDPILRMSAIEERRGNPAKAAHLMWMASVMEPSDERIRAERSRLMSMAEADAEEREAKDSEVRMMPEPIDDGGFDDLFPFVHVPEKDDKKPQPEPVRPEEVPVHAEPEETEEQSETEIQEPVVDAADPVDVHEESEVSDPLDPAPSADGSVTEEVQAPVVVVPPKPEPVPEMEPEPQAEGPVQEEPDRREDLDSLCSMASSLREAGDTKGALRTIERGLAIDPGHTGMLRLKAQICLDSGDFALAEEIARGALETDPDDADLHLVLGMSLKAGGDREGALAELDRAVSLGADDADVHAARGEVLEAMGVMDRASECYSAAVSRDPSRLDLAEKLARMMYARKEAMAADGMINRILRRDPGRISAILLKAEIAHARKDDKSLMAAYGHFVKVPNPGPENTVRMARLLEDSGHTAEAKELVVGRPQKDVADSSVKRYAEKVLRRSFAMRVPPTDPDLIGAFGLDQRMAAEVAAYLGEQPNYGPINRSSEAFARMEARSRDAVMRLQWRNLEREPRLPLERVFVQCGCSDADEAKDIVAYVMRAMISEPGRVEDPEIAKTAMGLPKGISVYEIMESCDVGVYTAKEIQAQII